MSTQSFARVHRVQLHGLGFSRVRRVSRFGPSRKHSTQSLPSPRPRGPDGVRSAYQQPNNAANIMMKNMLDLCIGGSSLQRCHSRARTKERISSLALTGQTELLIALLRYSGDNATPRSALKPIIETSRCIGLLPIRVLHRLSRHAQPERRHCCKKSRGSGMKS